jgi:hypothetical protein
VATVRPDELERLLWEQTEGTLSAADHARLDAYLAAEPTAERQRRDVKLIAGLLATVKEVDPPPALQKSIQTAILARPRPRPRLSLAGALQEMLAPKWRVRIAWAVVGMVAGVTATALIVADFGTTSRDDVARYYGSMAPPTSGAPITLELPGSLGAVTLQSEDGAVAVDLAVTRPIDGGVAVELSGAGLAVASCEGSGATSRVEASADGVLAELAGAGRLRMRTSLAPQTGSIVVRVSMAGRQIAERRFEPRRAPGS